MVLCGAGRYTAYGAMAILAYGPAPIFTHALINSNSEQVNISRAGRLLPGHPLCLHKERHDIIFIICVLCSVHPTLF